MVPYSISQFEGEWLSTNIHKLFQKLSADKVIYEDGKNSSSTMEMLMTLTPTIVETSTIEIPKHWKTEQILDCVAAECFPETNESFQIKIGKTNNTKEYVELIQQPISKHPNTSYTQPINDYVLNNNILKQKAYDEKINTLHHHNPKDDAANEQQQNYAETQFASLSSFETGYFTAENQEKPNKYQLKLLYDTKTPEKFGSLWIKLAINRLKLPMPAAAQVQRLHDIAVNCYKSKSLKEIDAEKSTIKNELKNYDRLFLQKFGRWPNRQEKEPLRGLYTYYRRIKLSMERLAKSVALSDSTKEKGNSTKSQILHPNKTSSMQSDTENEFEDEIRLTKLQEEKALIRNKLQEFQRLFYAKEGRMLKYHRDIVSVEHEYKQYKMIRDHINRLTEKIKRKKELKHFNVLEKN